jgi:hypothetical protein
MKETVGWHALITGPITGPDEALAVLPGLLRNAMDFFTALADSWRWPLRHTACRSRGQCGPVR